MADSSSSNTPRPWSAEEDNLLKQAVAQYGDEPGMWKIISECVPGRTNKACRKRWLHSLSPTIRKTSWTAAEDALLLKLYATHNPPRWSLIAKHIPGRTDDACSKRYREALDPQLKKDGWTAEEDAKLVELTAQLGSKWTQVGQAMGRSGLGCRNRWRLLQRKQQPRKTARPPLTPDGTCRPVSPYAHPTDAYVSIGNHLPDDLLSPGATSLPPQGIIPFHDGPSREGHNPAHHSNASFSDIISVAAGQTSSLIHGPPLCTISTVSSLSGALASASSSTLDAHRDSSPCSFIDPDLISTVQTPPHSESPKTIHANTESYTVPPDEPASAACSQSPQAPPGSPKAILENQDPSLIVVPSTPPEHPGADPGTGTSRPGEPLSAHPRKRPRLHGPPSAEHDVTEHPRLSSHLPADLDRTVLPYACGHPLCWPGATGNGASRFATASELAEHRRLTHPGNDNASVGEGSKVYRCALQGCGKGWKNINGIQYHLQISKAHFKAALSQTRAPSDTAVASGVGPTPDVTQTGTSVPPKNREANTLTGKRKEHHCPHEGCPNSYKQRTGLQYHLAHGHPANVAQLQVIPPALMRKIKAGTQPSVVDHQQKAPRHDTPDSHNVGRECTPAN